MLRLRLKRRPLVCGSISSAMSSVSNQGWPLLTKKRVVERNINDLLCYRKLVSTSITSPFIVPGISGYDKKVRTSRTEQHDLNAS